MIQRATDATGLTKAELFRRLLKWFDAQADVVQQEILGTLPESLRTGDIAKIVLEKMAKEGDVAGKIIRGAPLPRRAARGTDKGSKGKR